LPFPVFPTLLQNFPESFWLINHLTFSHRFCFLESIPHKNKFIEAREMLYIYIYILEDLFSNISNFQVKFSLQLGKDSINFNGKVFLKVIFFCLQESFILQTLFSWNKKNKGGREKGSKTRKGGREGGRKKGRKLV
jgi:hypothetical protein